MNIKGVFNIGGGGWGGLVLGEGISHIGTSTPLQH